MHNKMGFSQINQSHRVKSCLTSRRVERCSLNRNHRSSVMSAMAPNGPYDIALSSET
jgi:hypothetical protein